MKPEICFLYMERIQKLLESLKPYYGLGVSNGIGTAGLKTAREEIKEDLEKEIVRLHQAVIALAKD